MMLTRTEAGVGAPAAGAGAGAGAVGSGAGAGAGAGAGGASSRVVSLPPVPGAVTVPSTDGDDGIDAWLQLDIPSAQTIRKTEKAALVRMPHCRSNRSAGLSYRKQMMLW